MHVCQSGCRVLLGMMSTSEPTCSSASAASERSSCILISFSTSLLAYIHKVHTPTQGPVFRQGKAHHAGSLSQCQLSLIDLCINCLAPQLALKACGAEAAAVS